MIDAIWEKRTVEDYETTSYTVKTDFMRKWHQMMENEDGNMFEVADPQGEFEQKVILNGLFNDFVLSFLYFDLLFG